MSLFLNANRLLFVLAGILFFISSIQQQAAIMFGVPPNFEGFPFFRNWKEIFNLKGPDVLEQQAKWSSHLQFPSKN